MNSTDSEFKGFLKDEFTTLAETDDRILATSLVATWRHDRSTDVDWEASYDAVLALLLQTFAGTYSRALQETLYAMGTAVLEADPGIADISFAAPNKHHFLVDFSGFDVEGLTNDGEVFIAADRPYGLIEATVVRTAETTREVLLGCLAVPRWADDVLAGQPYAGRAALLAAADAAARVAHRRGARPGAVGPPADRRARRCAVAAGAVRRRPVRRRHRGAAGGRQRGVRAAVRPGLPDPGGRSRRRRDPGRARPAAAERRRDRARRDRRQPAPDRAAAAGRRPAVSSPSRRTSSTPPTGSRVRHPGRAGDPRRHAARRGRHRPRRPDRLARRRAPRRRLRAPVRRPPACSSRRSSSCSRSPTSATTTCRCCSAPTATRPTVAADLCDSHPRPARGGRRGRGRGLRGRRPASGSSRSRRTTSRRPPRGRSTWPTTRCCCPAWSTPTCTSTSRGAPSGRGSRPPPGRPRRVASPRSWTCRSTRSRRPRRSPGWRPSARWPRARSASTSASGAARCPATSPTSSRCTTAGVFGFKCFLLDSGRRGVRPPRAGGVRAGDDGDRPARRADDRARRGRRPARRGRARRGQLRRVPRVAARRCRGVGDRPGRSSRPSRPAVGPTSST